LNQRVAPGPAAIVLMVMLCTLWGFQQVTVKIAMAGVSPILQGGLRSAIAASQPLGWPERAA